MAPIFALSIHADYGCAHSGACCSTAWDVPVEVAVHRGLNAAMREGRLRTQDAFVGTESPPEGAAAVLRRRASGACVFFDGRTRHCEVHRALGPDALPVTCRLFPRIALSDARGTFITLSHYCPTAAAMLFRDDCPLAIVEAPTAFPPGDYDGLVAEDAWPPLLHPRMLIDLEDYSAWERHAVARCADDALSPEQVIAALAQDVEALRTWRPGGASLAEVIAGSHLLHEEDQHDTGCREDAMRHPVSCLTLGWHQEGLTRGWNGFDRVVKRYLAAHAFASWCAYQGRGLRTFVRSLEAALALLRTECQARSADAGRPLDRDLLIEAIRASDWWLRHEASREQLVREWSRAEDDAAAFRAAVGWGAAE